MERRSSGSGPGGPDFKGTLDLRKGKEGDYTLQVTVTDLNSGAKAARETTFRVEK